MSKLNNLEPTHMDPLSIDDVARMDEIAGPCVSIYLPMRLSGRETRENPIRLKNASRDAIGELIAEGMKPRTARALLAPTRPLIKDSNYWQYQSNGLAVFAAPGYFRAHRLPLEFSERVTAAPRFVIKPLLPLFQSDGLFYVLALSLNKVRVFRGSRLTMAEIKAPGMPASLSDALPAHSHQRQSQVVTQGVNSTAVRFGNGDEHSPQFHLMAFFKAVDRALRPLISAAPAPLVLAGVEDYHARYREVDSTGRLTGLIAGNPDEETAAELHRRALELIEPQSHQPREQAIARFQDLTAEGTGHTSNYLQEILPAACAGRISDLFVTESAERWGLCDRETFQVHLHHDRERGDEDLLELCAAKTLFQNGAVWALAQDIMPGGGEVAAILRY